MLNTKSEGIVRNENHSQNDLLSAYNNGLTYSVISNTNWPTQYGLAHTYKMGSARGFQFATSHKGTLKFRNDTTYDSWANWKNLCCGTQQLTYNAGSAIETFVIDINNSSYQQIYLIFLIDESNTANYFFGAVIIKYGIAHTGFKFYANGLDLNAINNYGGVAIRRSDSSTNTTITFGALQIT